MHVIQMFRLKNQEKIKIERKEGGEKGLESLGYLVCSCHPSCFYTSVGTKRSHANKPKEGNYIICLKFWTITKGFFFFFNEGVE